MKTFFVRVTEKLERVVEVEANEVDEALEKVQDMYADADIVLDSEDFNEVEFNIAD